ncbi:MAG TPA: Uma2 family endonuclease [Bryobacteraceae bacterium]
MAFLIDEAFLPATLTARPMTDQEFAAFCAEHPDLFFEMTAEGELIVMPPTYTLTGIRNTKILRQLEAWSEQDGRGVASGSSDGFVLPNGARRSPDAAWTSKENIQRLSSENLEGYWHLCPDFIIELKSKTDRLRVLREKMNEWIANGAQLAWLIDPETKTVEIFRPGRDVEVVTGADSVKGEGPVEGFTLELRSVWDPIGV